jgi:cell wall-associated NlpC family hydrolase
VGIALDGERFVHAPSSRGVVRIERYTSSYWAKRYVGARRIEEEQSARK